MPLYLDRSENNSAPNGTSAQVKIPVGPFKHDALVMTTAHGTSHYVGPTANAGIILALTANGHVVMDDSFEGEAGSMSFRSAAAHNFILPAEATTEVVAEITPQGAGGTTLNRQTKVDLHVIAVGLVLG